MNGEIRVRTERPARVFQPPDGGGVDGAVVGGIVEALGPQMDGRRVHPRQPVDERLMLRGRVVRQEHERVERAIGDDAADGTASGTTAFRAIEVRLADPGEQHGGHGDTDHKGFVAK